MELEAWNDGVCVVECSIVCVAGKNAVEASGTGVVEGEDPTATATAPPGRGKGRRGGRAGGESREGGVGILRRPSEDVANCSLVG